MAYLDTSILGSYYTPEALTPAVRSALLRLDQAAISPLVRLEFASLISLKVRNKDLDAASGDRVVRQFEKHLSANLFAVVDIDSRDFAKAQRWLAKLDTTLRTLDAIHLAIASRIRIPIWTTDKLMAKSARQLAAPFRLIS